MNHDTLPAYDDDSGSIVIPPDAVPGEHKDNWCLRGDSRNAIPVSRRNKQLRFELLLTMNYH